MVVSSDDSHRNFYSDIFIFPFTLERMAGGVIFKMVRERFLVFIVHNFKNHAIRKKINPTNCYELFYIIIYYINGQLYCFLDNYNLKNCLSGQVL